ncbi:hypothetical protein EJ110_NYTH27568 [Nymphaea thermarum]|nr:hypothetical protein EJ110_NYTH27568 [Nymphaea thermarum]
MAASSSSTVNQTEIGGVRTENVPMQVINLRLTKENYFSWSPAMTMGIAARDRMTYIDGSNPEPAKTSVAALSNYGFPWTKLGLLYSHDASIFDIDGSLLHRRLDAIIELGFSRTQLFGICLAFPFVLGRREEESTGEDDGLFDYLKWVLLKSHLADSRCLDSCYVNCRKVGIFYDLGCEKGTIGEALGECERKGQFLSRLGMKNEDVGRLIVHWISPRFGQEHNQEFAGDYESYRPPWLVQQ